MESRRKRRSPFLLVATLLVAGTVAVPLAKLILPGVYRHLQLSKLTSDDAGKRAEGQTYLIRMADRDPKVLAGAIERLSTEDERAFVELMITLDQTGHWTRSEIPLDPWLRWLSRVVKDADPEERIRGVQLLADLPEHAADERVLALFEAAVADPDPAVRYNALVCVAEMRGAPAAATVHPRYDKLITRLASDAKPVVARHAVLFLGLLGLPAPSLSPGSVNPQTGEAVIWATATRGGEALQAATATLQTESAAPELRAMAAYVLGQSPAPEARDALIAFLDQGPRAVTDANQVAFWRAILSLPLRPRPKAPEAGTPPAPTDDPGYAALVRFLAKCTREDYDNVHLRPLILACLFRDRWLLVDAAIKQSDIVTIADDPVAWLASVEGVPQAVAQGRGPFIKIAPPESAHEQIRLAIVRAMAEPKPDDFLPLLTSEKSAVRDQACIIAVQRLSSDQQAQLVERLVRPFDRKGDPLQPVLRYQDAAKYSAAMLAGMAEVQTETLHRLASDFADRPGIIEIIQLGLWMQGEPVKGPQGALIDMRSKARQLLMREDLPSSTVLLALLHMKDRVALEHLLTPRGDQNPKLLRLLDEDRWWFVLDHFLPKETPPGARLWVWADNDLARFQLDVLRNWYVLNRHRL